MARIPQYGYMGGAFGLCGLMMAFTAPTLLPDPVTAVDTWMRSRAIIDGEQAVGIDPSTNFPAAVHLILNLAGRPIASTWAATAAGATDPVQQATQALLVEAHDDRTLANTPPALLAAGLRQTTLEAETAGPFQPIVSRTLAEAAQSLNPATDGIALRVKDRWWVRFPSSLRFTGSALGLSTLHELAAVSGLTPGTLAEYRRSGQATLYRFETIDLIQLPGEDLPRTYRRGDMHDGWECNRAAILTQLQLVTQYLASHLQLLQGDGSDETALVLRGDLLPFTGRYVPTQATTRDLALFEYAMDRARTALGVANTAELSVPISHANDDAVAAAYSIVMNPQSPAETFAQVRELLTETEQPLADRAIAAWALTHNQNDRLLAQNFIEESTQLPPTELIGMLPWIGWADIRLAESNGRPPRLANFWHILAAKTASSVTGSTPPTAQFLPSAAFLASVATTDVIPTVADQHDFQQNVCQSLELLDMLVVSENEAKFFPTHPVGGVRLTLSDERMSIRAQAMAILLLSEALGTMPDTVNGEE